MNLCFIVNFYNEIHIIERCLSSIRCHYPNSELILISDGNNDPELKNIAERCSARLVLDVRLKTLRHGGRWVHRYCNEFYKGISDLLIKVDPDSIMHRKFTEIPASDYFGPLVPGWPFPLINGSCKGFSRKLASLIVENKLALSRHYVGNAQFKRGFDRQISEDLICMDIVNKTKTVFSDWSEINITPNIDCKYSVTHGHK